MAGTDDVLTHVVRLLSSFDDGAFEALASRGLLRRARKDLERVTPNIVETDGDELHVAVDRARVVVPRAGPTRGRCDCPAPGICRHILVACLHLQRLEVAEAALAADAPAEDRAALRAELLAIDEESLVDWAGRKTVAHARALLAETEPPQVTLSHDGARVAFAGLFVEARFFRGTGLDGMLPAADDAQGKRVLVAAVLALQRALGAEDGAKAPERSPTMAQPAGAPRTPVAVLETSRELLEGLIRAGLSHPSDAAEQRATALSVSATAVHLPRLARELRAIATEVAHLRARHAQGDEGRLLWRLARSHALCEALLRAGPDRAARALVGEHRSRYEPLRRLDLAGLGATPWRTRSGYHGLTVLLWAIEQRRWVSWSDARPAQRGFDPAARYHQPGPFRGVSTPHQLCRSRVTLLAARKNDHDRLSTSAETHALVIGPSDPRAIDFGAHRVQDFSRLAPLAANLLPQGLRGQRPLGGVVVVQPARWGERTYDEINQRLCWTLHDEDDRALPLVQHFDEQHKGAVALLERLDEAALRRVWGVVGQLAIQADGRSRLVLHPRALLVDDDGGELRVVNVALDALSSSASAKERSAAEPSPPADAAAGDGDEDDGDEQPGDALDAPFQGLEIDPRVARFERLLERWAERGVSARIDAAVQRELQGLGAALDRAALSLLAQAAGVLAEGRAEPGRLLSARYLCELHRQAGAQLALAESLG